MKILYLSDSIIPSRTANSIHVMKMCEAFAHLHNQVVLVSNSQPDEAEKNVDDVYKFYSVENCFKITEIDKNKYISNKINKYFLKKKLKTGTNLHYKNVLQGILNRFKPDVVIGRELTGCEFACRQGYKVIYEHHILLPEKIKNSFLKMANRGNFTRFIAITNILKNDYIKFGLNPDKIMVLADGANEVDNLEEKISLHGNKNFLKVGYVGHLYEGKGMEVIEKIAPLLPDVDFCIVGGLQRDIDLWKTKITSDNVHFYGFVPQSELSPYLNAFDICLLPNQRNVYSYEKTGKGSNIGEYTSPLKMFDYMAHKKPIIASDLPVLREILNEENAVLVSPDNSDEWVNAINTLRNENIRNEIAEKAYQDFVGNYTWQKRAEKILETAEKKLRIAFVTDEYVTENTFDGGLANYLYRVSLSLKDMGHTPVIITMSNRNEKIIHSGIEVNRVKIRHKAKLERLIFCGWKKHELFWRSYELNRALKKLHRDKPFDIVQYPNYNSLSLFRPKNIPAVQRISSYLPLWDKAYGRRTLKRDLELENASFFKVDRVFGPANILADAIKNALNVQVKIIETPFLPETTEENNEIYDRIKASKYLLFFGRLGLMKGIKTIADMLPVFFEQYPDYNFVFVGKCIDYTNFQALNYIYDKAGKYKDRICYYEKILHDRLYPVIKGAEAVVLPSRIDNMPNACLETMAHRKIVIGTRGASFEQLIDDGESGFLCEIDNPDSLLEAINKALALSEEEKRQIGEKAFLRIQKLRPEIVVSQLVGFYREVLH